MKTPTSRANRRLFSPRLWLLPLFLSAALPVLADPAAKSGFELARAAETAAMANQWDEAEALMAQAVARMREESGAEHPSVGMNLRYLAELQSKRGRHEESIRSFSEATALLEKALGRENPMAFSARYRWLEGLRKLGRFAEASTVARELLETLTKINQSGVAWDNVSLGNQGQGLKLPVQPHEGGIADVTSLLGLSLASSGKDAEARPVLLESLAQIEKLFGSGHPRAVEIQQALEKIAIARGEAIGRRFVGDLSSIRKLAITGSEAFSPDELRLALAQDGRTILASHPSAPFSNFLEAIESALTLGYAGGGFPEAKVKAVLQASPDQPTAIAVTIIEGPRFRKGRLTVDCPDEALAAALILALTSKPEAPGGSLLARVDQELATALGKPDQEMRQLLEQISRELPQAQVGVGAPGGLTTLQEKPLQPMMMNFHPDTEEAFWESGVPVDFNPTAEKCTVQHIQSALEALGHPIAQWDHQLRRQADGSCDLAIMLNNPGPPAVIGTIKVMGNRKNTAEQIIALTGLKSGTPLDPKTLGAARLALWDSGRFWPFTIQSVPPADGSSEIGVVIAVREIAQAPALDVPLTEVQQAGLTVAREINRSMESEGFTCKGLKNGLDVELSHVPGHGLGLRLHSKEFPDLSMILAMDREAITFVVRGKSRTSLTSIPFSDLNVHLKVMPKSDSRGETDMFLFLLAGFRTCSSGEAKPVEFKVLFAPSFVFLTKINLTVEDGKFIATSKDDGEQFTADAVTGRLLGIAGAPVAFGSEPFESILAEIEAAKSDPSTQRAAMSWADLLARGLGRALRAANSPDAPEPSGEEKDDSFATMKREWIQTVRGWWPALAQMPPARIDAAERTFIRLVFPILNRFMEAIDAPEDDAANRFTIAPDAKMMQNMPLSLLLGLGYVSFSEQFFPPDSWTTTLSKELLFSLSGNSRYTASTLDTLLADPTIGPFGSLFASQLIQNIDPDRSRRFVAKALDQCHSEGFRQDWKLALREETGLGQAVKEFLDTLAGLTPAEEADLAMLVGKEQEPWLRDFLAALRQRPPGQTLADCLAPHLDKLWNHHLGPVVKAGLNQRLHPPVDAAKFAATANGRAFSRSMVDFIRELSWTQPLPGSSEKEPGGDTWNIARRDLIRMGLVHQAFVQKGFTIDPAKLEAGFVRFLPETLRQAGDAEFQKAFGLTRAEALSIFELNMVFSEMVQQYVRNFPPPSAKDVADWLAGPGKGIADEFHLHKISLPVTEVGLSGKYITARKAYALGAALGAGLPENLLVNAIRLDGESLAGFSCSKSIARHALLPVISDALAGAPDGGWSKPLAENDRFSIFHPISRKPGKLPEGEYGTAVVQGLARRHLQTQAVAKWLEQLESQASIDLFDGPRPDAESDQARILQNAADWAESNPGCMLARLTRLWLVLPAKEPAAIEKAFTAVLAKPTFDPARMSELTDALTKAGHPDLAARVAKEAEANR